MNAMQRLQMRFSRERTYDRFAWFAVTRESFADLFEIVMQTRTQATTPMDVAALALFMGQCVRQARENYRSAASAFVGYWNQRVRFATGEVFDAILASLHSATAPDELTIDELEIDESLADESLTDESEFDDVLDLDAIEIDSIDSIDAIDAIDAIELQQAAMRAETLFLLSHEKEIELRELDGIAGKLSGVAALIDGARREAHCARQAVEQIAERMRPWTCDANFDARQILAPPLFSCDLRNAKVWFAHGETELLSEYDRRWRWIMDLLEWFDALDKHITTEKTYTTTCPLWPSM